MTSLQHTVQAMHLWMLARLPRFRCRAQRLEIADLRTEMLDRFNKLDRSLRWKLSVAVAAAAALSELRSRM